MKNSRLLQLIQILSSSELKSIKETLLTTKDSKDQSYKLLNIISNHNSETLTKSDVYIQLFGKQAYNDQKLRLLMSDLLKSIEKIIIEKEMEEKEDARTLSLLSFYRRKGLDKHYNSTWRKWNTKKHQFQNAEYHQELASYEIEKYEYLSSQRRNQELNIQTTLDQIDLAYLSKKLKHACLALAHSSVYNINYDMGIGHLVFGALDESPLLKYPAIDMYYSCYQMLCNPDSTSFFNQYRKDIKKYSSLFPPSEMRTLFLLGINICIRMLNEGKVHFGAIGLELYNECLSKKYLILDGHLSRYTYRNIVMMAIRVGAFEWASTITEKYRDQLKKEEEHAAYHFNKALISYHAENLEEALDHIVEADFKDHLINLAAKTLQAKMYYQLEQSQLLESHLESMEMYIIRNKILGYHRANYKKLLSYMKKLVRLNKYDKNNKVAFLSKINSEDHLTEKEWFIKQLVS